MPSLPDILKNNNYSVPKCIKEYRDENIKIELEQIPLPRYRLFTYEKDISTWKQWMTYRADHKDILDFVSHYDLAEGHVICAGLGFGCREQWILNKPEVTKVTVLEKNKHLIEYHKKFYENDKIEYVCCDYKEYVGECDVLLLDPWEGSGDKEEIIKNSNDIFQCLENIKCKSFWAWPIEYFYSYEEYKDLLNIFENLALISENKYVYYRSLRNL